MRETPFSRKHARLTLFEYEDDQDHRYEVRTAQT